MTEIERELHDKEARIRELEREARLSRRLFVEAKDRGNKLEAALERLIDAADPHMAAQDHAPDPRCGLTQPITVAEGEELNNAVANARATITRLHAPPDSESAEGAGDEDEHGGCPPINAYQALGDLRECAEEPGSWLPKWKADRNEQMVRKAMGAKELGAASYPPGGYYLCPKCGEDVCGCDDEQQDAVPERRDAGDALREKLADPETMQRVTERAAEQQDAMMDRREALEIQCPHCDGEGGFVYDMGSEGERGEGCEHCDGAGYLTPIMAFESLWACFRAYSSCMEQSANLVRQALSRTSDEGTGCVVPEATVRYIRDTLHFAMSEITEREDFRQQAQECIDELDRAFAEQGGQRVPEGWKLVPVEPTTEMVVAMLDQFGGVHRAMDRVIRGYRNAMAAAPQPEHGEWDE